MLSSSGYYDVRYQKARDQYMAECARQYRFFRKTSSQYSFYGNNQRAFESRDRELILAGPADTGKTLTMLSKLHLAAQNHPGASMVIARKQLTDTYSTVLQTYIKKVLTPDDQVSPYGGEKPQWFDYPNGTRIWVAGLDKPGKVLSAEHDMIYVNQAEELDVIDWETLTTRASGRAGNMPYSQCLGDANPGPPLHWILARANEGHLTKIDSTHRDNPEIYDQETGELTEEGIKRLDVLKRLSGSRLLRLFHGLWAAPEGAIYSVFEEEKHKVEHFEPPRSWPRIVAIDPYGAIIAAVWFAYDPENRKLNIYREYRGEFGISTTQHARNILDIVNEHGETIFAYVGGGPSENQQRVDFTAAGIPLIDPPNVGVDAGIDRVIDLLGSFGLVVHDNCIGTLSDISSYKRKMVNGIITDTIENKDIFHFADCVRYGVVFLSDGASEQQQVSYNPIKIGNY